MKTYKGWFTSCISLKNQSSHIHISWVNNLLKTSYVMS